MAFELPNLPYDYDALAPYMSRETLEYHHDKHHLAYVTNGNKLAEEAGLADLSLEDIVKKSYGTNQPLFNNAGQHYNHLHFWKWMKKGGGGTQLPGKLDAAIKSDLGGYDKFRSDFLAAGAGQFGSGWAWLSVKGGKLEISKTPNGENPLVHGRIADPWRRCLGTFLLYRLPQRPPEVPRSLRRQPDQLGLRARALRKSRIRFFRSEFRSNPAAMPGFFVAGKPELWVFDESDTHSPSSPLLWRGPVTRYLPGQKTLSVQGLEL